jgi:hypothetical protein
MVNEDLPMIAKGVSDAYKAGMQSERLFFTEMLQPIFAAFMKAQGDEKARIPSYLSAAIVAARSQFVLVTPSVREKQRA